MKDTKIVYFIPNSKAQYFFTHTLINIIAFLPFIILFSVYKIIDPIIHIFWFILLATLLMFIFKKIAKEILVPLFGSKNTLIITKEKIEIKNDISTKTFTINENIIINGYEAYEVGLIPTIQIKHQMQIILTLPSTYVIPSSFKAFNYLYSKHTN